LIAIDLGSNSIRVLKYSCKKSTTIGEFERTVSTADGINTTQEISKDAIDRVIKAIDDSIELLNYNPKKAIAYTTAALRIAKNSKYVLEYIQKHTGVKFEIIDGQTEANLATKKAILREGLYQDKFIAIDIGGGSTEMIIHSKKDIVTKSFDIGLVTLTQSSNKNNIIDKLKKDIKSFISNIDTTKYILISTAGTPTTIAALKLGLNYRTYDKNLINGTKITKKDIKHFRDYLKSLSPKKLDKTVGQNRGIFIDAGFEILYTIYQVLSKTSSIVVDDGLREGIAYSYCISKYS
jgi:exopolyphosphatase/guanosine-5'-triphosphate,3'-diphosphate pyrophosphatase